VPKCSIFRARQVYYRAIGRDRKVNDDSEQRFPGYFQVRFGTVAKIRAKGGRVAQNHQTSVRPPCQRDIALGCSSVD
jgi:hypothetical protein